MNLPPSVAAPAPPSSSAPRRNWPRLLLNAAVTLVVLAVAAATFVLSYAGVHAIALQGGVSVQLARIYPGLFDAVLVIACVAAVVLRDGRWWARAWAWLVVIVILGAIGVTDVLHAADYALRHRTTEGVVAAAPVVAVLLAFSLLLTVLRQSRPQAPDAAQAPRGRAATPIDATAIDATAIDAVPVVAAGAVPRPPAPPIALPPAPPAEAADEPHAESAVAPDATAPPAETVEIPAYPGDPEEAADAGEAAAAAREEDAPEAVETLDDQATPDAETTPDAPELAPEAPDNPEASDDPIPPTEPAEAVAAQAPTPDHAADADADEPVAEPPPPPTRPATQAIRYASSAAAEDWESEVDPDLAGQVYPVLTSDPDIDTSRYPDEPQDAADDEAPPFATAPFASVPRLNRVRVTPIPPNDED
jgi:hypothetical protein